MRLYCWSSGLIEIGRKTPEGAIFIAEGKRQPLEQAVSRRARLSYTGQPLVPGVPEADTWQQKAEALNRFTAAVYSILLKGKEAA